MSRSVSRLVVAAAVAAPLALGGAAQAGLSDKAMQIQTMDFMGVLSPFGPMILTFDQFEEVDGLQLTAVQLLFEAKISAQVTAENNNEQPAPEFGVALTGFVNVDVPAPPPGLLSATATLDAAASSGGVAGSDGVDGSGPDFVNFGVINDQASADDLLVAGAGDDLSAFIGNGTVDATVFAQGGFTVTGASSAEIVVSNFGVMGTVTIKYFFIPAPGAAALFALAGVTRRRRR